MNSFGGNVFECRNTFGKLFVLEFLRISTDGFLIVMDFLLHYDLICRLVLGSNVSIAKQNDYNTIKLVFLEI